MIDAAIDEEAKLLNRQLRRELCSFLAPGSEASDQIADTTCSQGLEAWRLLKMVCQPETGHRTVVDIREILHPAQCRNLADVPQALARWESHVRTVTSRTGKDPIADPQMKKGPGGLSAASPGTV